jgi:hypothetical protein
VMVVGLPVACKVEHCQLTVRRPTQLAADVLELAALERRLEADALRAAAGRAAARLATSRARVARARAANEARGVALQRALRALGAAAAGEAARGGAPARERGLAALACASEARREEQRRALARLLDVVGPLELAPPSAGGRVLAVVAEGKRAGGASAYALRLPDAGARYAAAAAVPCGLPDALGRGALLVEGLAALLRLPLPLRVAARGGRSAVWEPERFADARGAPAHALPLYWPDAAPGDARAVEGFADACALLQRGAAALACARLGPDAGVRLRPEWAPFAWLVGLCAVLEEELRAPRARRGAPPPPAGAASAVFGRRGAAGGSAGAASFLSAPEEEDGGEAGWELPPLRVLPPPPHAAADVAHWERSLHGAAGGGGSPAERGAAAAARAVAARWLAWAHQQMAA